ncbi:FACT complex subunit spt16 [Chytridiales sp. JEL 0842]|nr:FACT complex subunit spt16 [Chytridiales sp. JEL 0842]
MVELDAKTYHKRVRYAQECWKNPAFASDYADVEAILIVTGEADDDMPYLKSSSMQLWLLGYEFPDTITLMLPDKMVFLTSQKKGSIIETLLNAKGAEKTQLEVLKRTKDPAANEVLFKTLLKYLDGKKIGGLPKEKVSGKFIKEWESASKEAALSITDVSNGIANFLAIKDEEELNNVTMACTLTAKVMKNFFVEEFQNIIDEGKKVTHEKLSVLTDTSLTDEKKRPKLKFPKEADLGSADWCYPPIIQSGGKYDLRPSAQSDDSPLHDGTILCSMGVRYKNYCSNISRTFLVNPEKGKEANYNFLLELQSYVLGLIKDGAECKDIYNKATEYVQEKRPELVSHFVKNAGYGIGIEFKESSFTLSPKSTKALMDGMIINLSLGFQNLENTEDKTGNSRNKVYSLLIADTVRVTKDAPLILSQFDKEFKDISWEMNDEDEDQAVKKEKAAARNGNSALLKTKLRGDDREEELTNEQRRAQHQKQLADERNKEGLARFSEGADPAKALERATFRKFECYKKESLLPKVVDQLRIVVDRRNEAIILPIYGMPVPFHISTLKNLVKNEEGDTTYLRFNFATPGQSMGKKEVQPFEDPTSTFIRAITFRSSDMGRFGEIFREINDFKKEMQKREAERKEMADLVVQDKLIEVKGRRPHLLRDVFARPALETKRLGGDLELHTNGLRYQSALRSDLKIDITFSNIKHLFFQPCDGELIVVLHIHLKNEIMVGKKKTKDVQFYREVTDASFDETGNRKRRYNHGDEDEFAAEQEERQRRAQLNKEFKAFAERISEASRNIIEVDVPFRDLGFQGVPFKQPVLLQPTTDCLMHVIDPPFLVITIADIEIAHLERVRFGLKNFDLVFVFKDFTRPVQHINMIPSEQLEHVKEWLDSVDVPFTEGPTNLSWPQIMKTINENPGDFFNEGGWSFLQPESSDEEDEEDQESAYEESEFSEDQSESEDDYSSDESGSGYSDEDEDEESGEDWDELERKAAKSDRKRDDRDDSPPAKSSKKRRDDSDDDRPKKRR